MNDMIAKPEATGRGNATDIDLELNLTEAFAELTPREVVFVRARAAGKNGLQAAIEAGYAPSGAKARASRLLQRPRVRQAMELMQKMQAHESKYDVVRYMGLLEEALKFARENKSAMAFVNATKIVGEVAGHINKKVDVTVTHIDIGSALHEARARARTLPSEAETITFTEIEGPTITAAE